MNSIFKIQHLFWLTAYKIMCFTNNLYKQQTALCALYILVLISPFFHCVLPPGLAREEQR